MGLPANASLVRELNRCAVLDLIRSQSPTTRGEIARSLHLSLPTVTGIIQGLLADGLVCPHGRDEPSGGRPCEGVAFNGTAHAALGVDLGGTKMLGAVADLAGNIQYERYVTQPDRDGANCLGRLCSLIDDLLEAPRPACQQVRGIGVGAPGITDSDRGVVVWSPNVGWRDLPLQRILSDRFGLPVFVENDVNLAALGELGFGAGRGARDLVSLFIGTGMGAGIVLGGRLYHGAHQAAGEIGYMLPGVEALGRRYDGFGALESLAAGVGITDRARARLAEDGRELPEDGPSAEEVFSAAREGEPWARRIVDETVDYLCLAVSAVSLLLDPDVIVLGGGIARSADMLIEPILARLDGVLPYPPRLAPTPLGSRAGILGAVELVLKGARFN